MITEEEETAEERMKRKAIAQFLDVVPQILSDMGKSSPIVHAKLDDSPTPDFGLSEYLGITFTIDSPLKELMGDSNIFRFDTIANENGETVELCTNLLTRAKLVNVKIDYMTEQNWRKVMNLAFDTYQKFVNPF